jgi:hypothetical protein
MVEINRRLLSIKPLIRRFSSEQRKKLNKTAPRSDRAGHRLSDSCTEAAPNADLRSREYLTDADY